MIQKKVVYSKDDEIIEQFMGEEEESWWHSFAELHGIKIIEFKMEENPEAQPPIPSEKERLEALEMLMVDVLGGEF